MFALIEVGLPRKGVTFEQAFKPRQFVLFKLVLTVSPAILRCPIDLSFPFMYQSHTYETYWTSLKKPFCFCVGMCVWKDNSTV